MTDQYHLSDLATWVYNHAAPIGLMAGGVAGSALWAWREYMKRFATVQAVSQLKDENQQQHDELKQIINGNHVELLRTIMDKHK